MAGWQNSRTAHQLQSVMALGVSAGINRGKGVTVVSSKRFCIQALFFASLCSFGRNKTSKVSQRI